MTTDNSQVKPEECESCAFETPDLKAYRQSRYEFDRVHTGDSHKWLCLLCASTMAGNAAEYPEQYRGNKDVLAAICYVGNSIIQAIKEQRA